MEVKTPACIILVVFSIITCGAFTAATRFTDRIVTSGHNCRQPLGKKPS